MIAFRACLFALLFVLAWVASGAEKKEYNGKNLHEGKLSKHHTQGHWGEHWSMVGKPTSKHGNKESLKHGQELTPLHETKIQSELGYKKPIHDRHKASVADLHLQDLLMEESRHGATRMQKARPTHSTHHRQEGHQIPKPRPTYSDLIHLQQHGHPEGHNIHFHHGKPTPATSNVKPNKGHQASKQRKLHSKEKKQDKKYPKKFNRKHEKNNINKHRV